MAEPFEAKVATAREEIRSLIERLGEAAVVDGLRHAVDSRIRFDEFSDYDMSRGLGRLVEYLDAICWSEDGVPDVPRFVMVQQAGGASGPNLFLKES